MRSRVLVTGGAGFVGSVLSRQLLEKGYIVHCLDSLEKGDGDSLLDIINHKNFFFHYGDVRDYKLLETRLKFVDSVVHLAGYVGFPACSRRPEESYSVNVSGTQELVSRLSKDQRLVNASSGSVYGALDEICTEESPLNPQSDYGKQKKIAEDIVLEHPDSVSYRFATGFGVSPNMRVNLLPNSLMYEAIHNKAFSVFQPDAKRTFIPVQEMARALIFALENDFTGVYNCGHENFNLTKRELAEKIKEKTGCTVFYGEYETDCDLRDYFVDYSLLRNEGFTVNGTMEEYLLKLKKAVKLLRNTNLRYN
jgi:nucleoside-diphosphate-sugar epimerase